jgi:cellulose biosynthesis protein BcsQ
MEAKMQENQINKNILKENETKSNNNRKYILALLSGKGGAGKTVIGLSVAKVLSKIGIKVLLVDLDIATHGATYFFETELENSDEYISSVSDFFGRREREFSVLKTKDGFDFLPSTTNLNLSKNHPNDNFPEEFQFELIHYLKMRSKDYSVIIFDCQAGYSRLVEIAAQESSRSLLIMEADAVSSSALRVLFLQIGEYLKSNRTWQLINKLTEDERKVYEKVIGGTFFNNLPPIPFDWEVRAAFSTSNIPDVTSKGSAFGLGVLRVMKTIFPDFNKLFNRLELETIGDWFNDITGKLSELEKTKDEIIYKKIEQNRSKRMERFNWVSSIAIIIATMISVGYYFFRNLDYLWFSLPIAILAITFMLQQFLRRDIKLEEEQDKNQETINKLNTEIERFRTLIMTDPRLKEYANSIGYDAKANALGLRRYNIIQKKL